MARPKNLSASYFPLDVRVFSDVKVRQLRRKMGAEGVEMYFRLLCNIYADSSGFYLKVTSLHILDLVEYMGMTEETVKNAIDFMAETGLFDKNIYSRFGILTSHSIQLRFQEILKDRLRKNSRTLEVEKGFWVLGKTETLKQIIPKQLGENGVCFADGVEQSCGEVGEVESDESRQGDEAVGAEYSGKKNDCGVFCGEIPRNFGKFPLKERKEKERKGNKNKAEESREKQGCESEECSAAAAAAEQTVDLYESLIGKASGNVVKGIEEYINSGVEAALIMRLIEYAIEQGKPTWQYVNAAVRGNVNDGILTLEAYNRSREVCRDKPTVRKSKFNNYTDTNYKKGMYADFGDRIIEEMLREAEEKERAAKAGGDDLNENKQ